MSGDHNRYCSANKIETQDLTRQVKQRGCDAFAENMLKGATDTAAAIVKELQRENEQLHANAARYELMRDMALYEMQVKGTLPVSIEESSDWFDAMIDEKIRTVYPNATIGEVK